MKIITALLSALLPVAIFAQCGIDPLATTVIPCLPPPNTAVTDSILKIDRKALAAADSINAMALGQHLDRLRLLPKDSHANLFAEYNVLFVLQSGSYSTNIWNNYGNRNYCHVKKAEDMGGSTYWEDIVALTWDYTEKTFYSYGNGQYLIVQACATYTGERTSSNSTDTYYLEKVAGNSHTRPAHQPQSKTFALDLFCAGAANAFEETWPHGSKPPVVYETDADKEQVRQLDLLVTNANKVSSINKLCGDAAFKQLYCTEFGGRLSFSHNMFRLTKGGEQTISIDTVLKSMPPGAVSSIYVSPYCQTVVVQATKEFKDAGFTIKPLVLKTYYLQRE